MGHPTHFGNERGGGKIVGLFLLAAVIGAFYIGFRLIPVYMNAMDFKDTMRVLCKSSQIHGDKEILQQLNQKIRELDLPLAPENIIITHDPELTIEAHWQVTLEFPGGYTRTLDFHPIADGSGVHDAPPEN